MEAKLVVVNKGWAVVNEDWTAFGATQEEAINKFTAMVTRHMAILRGRQNREKEMMLA